MVEQDRIAQQHDHQTEHLELGEPQPQTTSFPSQSWLSMMLEPRRTLRAVLDSPTPSRHFWLILVLSVVVGILASLGDLPVEMDAAMLVGLVVALPVAVLITGALPGCLALSIAGWGVGLAVPETHAASSSA
ncbi:hypothetical protein [Ferrimonas gelatinilytica]|uniref:hypothetical protein n=1 Tax=Ferrimonas gelatinilytica TaxID=1255257 RepID=UPI0031F0701F